MPATLDDAAFLAEMAALFDYGSDSRAVRGWGARWDAGVLALMEDRRVGAAWYLRVEVLPGIPGHDAPMSREAFVGVASDVQRRGIGSALLAELVSRAQGDRTVEALIAIPLRSREAAMRLCRRCGFEELDDGRMWRSVGRVV